MTPADAKEAWSRNSLREDASAANSMLLLSQHFGVVNAKLIAKQWRSVKVRTIVDMPMKDKDDGVKPTCESERARRTQEELEVAARKKPKTSWQEQGWPSKLLPSWRF